ncbi:MAG: YgiQ family radical SAM protein [Lachnospiraceae bacterium]|nr:YgiQ family radical SAM protein [Lachnospiraceae bacterium]
MKGFLPVCPADMMARGWDEVDFVYVIGDAYVDHSSFGPAIISRVLEAHGYKVAIISQPDWADVESVAVFGRPKLGFLVSSGNMDSMVNHYTVNKKHRSQDAYTPGGKTGKRPDYATVVYCNLIKKRFKGVPVVIGGIEASLRRLGHYDYWSDKMKRSVLLDSGADLLIYGMGELAIVEIADALASGIDISDLTFVRGTVYKTRDVSSVNDGIMLPDYDTIASDRAEYARSFYTQYVNTDFVTAKPLIEQYGINRYVVQNPPQRPLTTEEFDDVYELPYMNSYHPSYDAEGGVPAINEIKFSLTSNRGCFGGCSFCALTFHQGRIVQVRSHESLVKEAEAMTEEPDFKGYIHDVGGPTANFRGPACSKQLTKGVCPNKQCLFPEVCKNVHADHKDYLELLRKLRKIPKVKKVFVRSGLRFDYILADPNGEAFLSELCKYHVSGQLRVAPEHVSTNVLSLMGKPKAEVYGSFLKMYERVNKSLGMEQFAVPYLMSSHPGSTLEDAIALAEAVRDLGYMPEQVQDYYPTPSTISTVMYYTGLDPRTRKKVYIPKTPHEKAMQRALIQYRKPENYELVKEALIKCHREDLIGFDHSKCLIPPRKMSERPAYQGKPGSDKTRGGKARSGKSQGGNNNPQRSVAAKNRTDSKREPSGNRPGTGRKSAAQGRKKK